jgi:hypothetical protein
VPGVNTLLFDPNCKCFDGNTTSDVVRIRSFAERR